MSTSAARTRESPATHRPERYRASLPRASARSVSIIQDATRNVNPARPLLEFVDGGAIAHLPLRTGLLLDTSNDHAGA